MKQLTGNFECNAVSTQALTGPSFFSILTNLGYVQCTPSLQCKTLTGGWDQCTQEQRRRNI